MSRALFEPGEGQPWPNDELLVKLVKQRGYICHERFDHRSMLLLKKRQNLKSTWEVVLYIDGEKRRYPTTAEDGNGHLIGLHEDLEWAQRSFDAYVKRMYVRIASVAMGLGVPPPVKLP